VRFDTLRRAYIRYFRL